MQERLSQRGSVSGTNVRRRRREPDDLYLHRRVVRPLLDFRRSYPHATEVRLVRSYRSTPQVVSLANRVLASSSGPQSGLGLELVAQRGAGPEPAVTAHDDELAEAAAVAKRIGVLLASGTPAREIGVLYRINAQSEPFEEALAEQNIPYLLRGESAFFDRAEVREAVTRLRGAARGGESTEPLREQVRAVLSAMGWTQEPPRGQGATRDKWENLLRVVTLADDLGEGRPEATLTDLVTDLDERATVQAAPTAAGVTLSTVHAAKGLEWDAVFVAGLADGTFPITFADTAARVEEERRLFYVAVTRAKTHLFLSWARARRPGGRGRRERSPFLTDVFGAEPTTAGTARVHRGSGSRGARDRPRRRGPATCSGCGAALVTGAESARGRCRNCPVAYDVALLERLKAWRKQESADRSVPAYVVFTDATLEVVAERRPADLAGLSGVPGIGAKKLEQYGATLLALVGGRRLRSPIPPVESPSAGTGDGVLDRFTQIGTETLLHAPVRVRYRPAGTREGCAALTEQTRRQLR